MRVKGCCEEVPPALSSRQAESAVELFRALSDPTRVQMIHMLRQTREPICVCDFTAAFDLGQPTVSHHLARLREAGLVRTSKRGLWSFYQLRGDLDERTRTILRALT